MTLKQLREDHDISQTDFAAMLGIGRASLIRYEQGIRTPHRGTAAGFEPRNISSCGYVCAG